MFANLRLYIIPLFLLCLLTTVDAQWREPRLTHLGPEEGISSWTFEITQDSTGYMYFGTDQGLVRYDGKSFELFAHNPNDSTSIGPGDVWCVYAGTEDEIWIGTRLSGLNVFYPKTRKFKTFPTPNKEKYDYDAVFSICEDQHKNIWVGGQNYMLHQFDKHSATFETFRPDWIPSDSPEADGIIDEILQDNVQPELLWLSITNHRRDDGGNDSKELVSFNTRTRQFKTSGCWGQPKYQDAEGGVWLASMGINHFRPNDHSCNHYKVIPESNEESTKIRVRDIIPYNNSYILSAPFTIISMSKNGNLHTIAQDKALGIVEDSYKDRQGNIWFGRTNGVSILSAQEELIKFYSLEKYGITNRIYPGRLAYDQNTNALFVVDKKDRGGDWQIIKIPVDAGPSNVVHTSRDFISGIAVDEQGKLWMNTTQQINALDLEPTKTQIRTPKFPCTQNIPHMWNLSISKEGWIGGVSHNRFVYFHIDKEDCHQIEKKDLPSIVPAESSPDFQGLSFISGQKALVFSNEVFEVDLNSGTTIRLKMENGVNPYPKTEINSVVEDSQGHIWVASLAMTAEFERQDDSLKLIKKYTTKDGMGSAWVHEMYPDQNGRIWAFAQNGLNAIDPVMQEVRQFGVREGLADPYADPRQVISLQDGSIATTNGNGVIIFHPDSLWNGYTPKHIPVVLKEIRTSGKTIEFADDVNSITQLELKSNENNIDIQFQGLAYPTDYNLNYSYKVEGLNKEWISIGENKIVTLSSLPPGKYTLKIKAGAASSPAPVKTIELFLATPLSQKPWFIALCIFTLVTVLVTIYRQRVQNIRKQEEEKLHVAKQMAELELKALRSQMNPHFMFNSLNSIKNYILQAQPNLAAEYLSNFSHLIRMILQNSGEKEISLQDELETLILYIELEQIRFENKFEFNCVIEDGLRLEEIKIPPMILQPYVENAIWHGLLHKGEEGHLLLSFSKDKEMVCCIIDDDGIGRKKSAEMKSLSATKYKSMGMGITKDRIDILNKMNALGIESEIIDKLDASGKPAGTRVIVRIPGSNHQLY